MNRPRSSKRGFTLIETVLVISSVALVLGLCAGLLHVLLRLDRIGRDHHVETLTVGRLARQFRQDVHAATGDTPGRASDDGPGARLELALPDGRIVAYEAREHAVVRTQRHGAEVERRESYRLPSCGEPRFLVNDDDGKLWVRLRLPRSRGPDTDTDTDQGPQSLRHDLHIDALAGRDARFSEGKETTP